MLGHADRRATDHGTTTMNLTPDNFDAILHTCRRLVPGAAIGDALGITVRRDDVALVIWRIAEEDGYHWAYAIQRSGVEEDRETLVSMEDLTSVLYQAFGPVVLPAILVEMLAVDARLRSNLLETAQAVLREPRAKAYLRVLWEIAEDCKFHCHGQLMLAAAAMVAPELGLGWRRPVITDETWDPSVDDLF